MHRWMPDEPKDLAHRGLDAAVARLAKASCVAMGSASSPLIPGAIKAIVGAGLIPAKARPRAVNGAFNARLDD